MKELEKQILKLSETITTIQLGQKKLKKKQKKLKKELDELTTKARKHIKSSNFALPGKRYPIHDKAHARNALARVAQHGTPEEQAKVRAAVHRKFPDIGSK